MVLYTDFVRTKKGQNYAGWSMVVIMSINFVVNIVIVARIGCKSIRLICVKYTNLVKMKFVRNKEVNDEKTVVKIGSSTMEEFNEMNNTDEKNDLEIKKKKEKEKK
jgi:hypothetical protein